MSDHATMWWRRNREERLDERLAAGAHLQAVYARALDEVLVDIPDLAPTIQRVELKLRMVDSQEPHTSAVGERQDDTRPVLRDVIDLLRHLQGMNAA